jgi:hypothetical protein
MGLQQDQALIVQDISVNAKSFSYFIRRQRERLGPIQNLKNDDHIITTLLEEITTHLESKDFDIRKSHFSRFTDQKCTPDVISFIADCIGEFIKDQPDKEFEVMDIWKNEFTVENTIDIFNKPSPKNNAAISEYNKFFGQPMRLLNYAGILNAEKHGTTYKYKCVQHEILEFISLKSANAFDFLFVYLQKVLEDSKFLEEIIQYKNNQNKDSLQDVKDKFTKFMQDNTPIRETLEPRRIFPKILNIFAVKWKMKGIERGYISKNEFYRSDLMYNRINWRDEGEKNKRNTRTEAEALIEQFPKAADYEINKAKKLVVKIHGGISEIQDEWSHGDATQKHHIFPKSEYAEFAADIENLIILTPTQHFTKAHPGNNNNEIDKEYQKQMLIAKSHSIEKNQSHYSKERFIEILNEGLDLELLENTSFDEIRLKLQ